MDQHAAQIRANARRNRRGKGPADLTADKDPQYITSSEIAERLGQKRETISVLAAPRNSRYPFRKAFQRGAVNYFNRAEVEAWLDAGAIDRRGHYRIAPKPKK